MKPLLSERQSQRLRVVYTINKLFNEVGSNLECSLKNGVAVYDKDNKKWILGYDSVYNLVNEMFTDKFGKNAYEHFAAEDVKFWLKEFKSK